MGKRTTQRSEHEEIILSNIGKTGRQQVRDKMECLHDLGKSQYSAKTTLRFRKSRNLHVPKVELAEPY